MFKNAIVFRLPAPWAMDLERLEKQLERGRFVPCPSNAPLSRGWVAPRKGGPLALAVNRHWLIALCTQERILPSVVVNDEVAERAEALAAERGHSLGRKQLRELRERVTEELLPRAFTRKSITRVWIDPVGGWLWIDAASGGKTEAVLEHLRLSLDEFPLSAVVTERSPVSSMTNWLAGDDAPGGFTIDRDCELKSVSEEKAAVRYVRHGLEGEEVKGHIVAGKLPTRLAMTWNDRLSFVLTEKLEMRRLTFLDLVMEEAEKQNDGKPQDEVFEADFALMTGELSRFLPDLLAVLGGERQEVQA